jgi:hypothetical protein
MLIVVKKYHVVPMLQHHRADISGIVRPKTSGFSLQEPEVVTVLGDERCWSFRMGTILEGILSANVYRK